MEVEAMGGSESARTSQAGEQLMAVGKLREALLAYEAVLSREPESLDAALGKAAALLSLGNVAEAGKALAAIAPGSAKTSRDAARYAFWLADWQTKAGDPNQALETLESAVKTLPASDAVRLHIQAASTIALMRSAPETGAGHLRDAWSNRDKMTRQEMVWMASVALMGEQSRLAKDAAIVVLKESPDVAALFILALSSLGALRFGGRLILFGLLVGLLILVSWGWLVYVVAIALLAFGGLLGWGRRLTGLMMSSLGLAGLLGIVLVLQTAYRLLSS